MSNLRPAADRPERMSDHEAKYGLRTWYTSADDGVEVIEVEVTTSEMVAAAWFTGSHDGF